MVRKRLWRLSPCPSRRSLSLPASHIAFVSLTAGDAVEIESLISAKTGACPEDCAFCSQAARYRSPIPVHAFLSTKDVLTAARSAAEDGAGQFCIVVSVRGPNQALMSQVLAAVEAIQRETKLDVHCSLGILNREQARQLKMAGVVRYNHNMETARSFFPRDSVYPYLGGEGGDLPYSQTGGDGVV